MGMRHTEAGAKPACEFIEEYEGNISGIRAEYKRNTGAPRVSNTTSAPW